MIEPSIEWVHVEDPTKLEVGDYINATTATYSQKWLGDDRYSDMNATYSGVVVSKCSNQEATDLLIRLDDGTIRNAVANVGSSGYILISRRPRAHEN